MTLGVTMTIEIRELLIKSSVTEQDGTGSDNVSSSEDVQQIKQELLEQCRQMILDLLAEREER